MMVAVEEENPNFTLSESEIKNFVPGCPCLSCRKTAWIRRYGWEGVHFINEHCYYDADLYPTIEPVYYNCSDRIKCHCCYVMYGPYAGQCPRILYTTTGLPLICVH